MKRLLFLFPTPSFVPTELANKEVFRVFSEYNEGDIIAIVNNKTLRIKYLNNFTLRGLYLPARIRFSSFKAPFYFLYAVAFALWCNYFRARYDAVIAYDPILTGLVGVVISKLTGAKLIVEVNGNYRSSFIEASKDTGKLHALKKRAVDFVIPFVLGKAHAVKLLYKDQLRGFPGIKISGGITCFHAFVPIAKLKPCDCDEKNILFLGFPWYLKGVDVLIKAFNRVSPLFPEYSLKVVGYCPDKSYFRKLAGDNNRIELCDPVYYEDAIKLISNCSLFILPSRTEAMGRVLLEAMACRKPIIASDVDGIPTYIIDGHTGLLFRSEDVDDLAEKMMKVLGDKSFAARLAGNGYEYVHRHLSERQFLDAYQDLLMKVLRD